MNLNLIPIKKGTIVNLLGGQLNKFYACEKNFPNKVKSYTEEILKTEELHETERKAVASLLGLPNGIEFLNLREARKLIDTIERKISCYFKGEKYVKPARYAGRLPAQRIGGKIFSGNEDRGNVFAIIDAEVWAAFKATPGGTRRQRISEQQTVRDARHEISTALKKRIDAQKWS